MTTITDEAVAAFREGMGAWYRDATNDEATRRGLEAAAPHIAADREAALTARLAAAERVCLLFGWGGDCEHSVMGEACVQAWREWDGLVGSEYSGPKAHPELDGDAVADLARKYRERQIGVKP